MSKKTIAVDIDDTITETLRAMQEHANKILPKELTYEDYKVDGEYWGFYERIWASHGIKDEIDAKQIYEVLHENQSLVPLLPGAEFAIFELMKRYNIVLITARDEKWKSYTEAWLEEQFGEKKPELYFSQAHVDTTSKTKGQICLDIGAEWLIDDNVGHCLSAEKEGVRAILFGAYGWHYQKPPNLLNLPDWPAVLEHFTNGTAD